MNVPTVMPSLRQMIHGMSCTPYRECRFDASVKPGNESYLCKKLDELLDVNDEMVLHDKAREIADLPQTNVVSVAPGIANVNRRQVLDRIDPYVKVEADEPGGDPDCPSCVAGKEHYHRKSDGSPVVSPDRQQNGIT